MAPISRLDSTSDPEVALAYFVEFLVSSTAAGEAISHEDLGRPLAHACVGAILDRLGAQLQMSGEIAIEAIDITTTGNLIVRLAGDLDESTECEVSALAQKLYSRVGGNSTMWPLSLQQGLQSQP